MLLEEETFVTGLQRCVKLLYESICNERFYKVSLLEELGKMSGESSGCGVRRPVSALSVVWPWEVISLYWASVSSFVKCGVEGEILQVWPSH